jgi:hypothetical protein
MDRFTAAVAAIDAANALDPNLIAVDGTDQPKELAHADVVERWLRALESEPTELQLLAARAHHLRRWVVPRSSYPHGRAGYLRWRADQKKRHAAEVSSILGEHGYEPAEIERVASLVAKRGLGRDPQVQTHEDALCLTFLELQLDGVGEQLGIDHTISVVAKTLPKMSARGRALAATVPTSPEGAAIVRRAGAAAGID